MIMRFNGHAEQITSKRKEAASQPAAESYEAQVQKNMQHLLPLNSAPGELHVARKGGMLEMTITLSGPMPQDQIAEAFAKRVKATFPGSDASHSNAHRNSQYQTEVTLTVSAQALERRFGITSPAAAASR